MEPRERLQKKSLNVATTHKFLKKEMSLSTTRKSTPSSRKAFFSNVVRMVAQEVYDSTMRRCVASPVAGPDTVCRLSALLTSERKIGGD